MVERIQLRDVAIDVTFKNIKNVHLSVHPPAGRVTISAPRRHDLETVRAFAIAKLPWIRTQQRKIREQDRETEREYLDRESHWVWGRRYLLSVINREGPPSVELTPRKLRLYVRQGTAAERREAVVDAWRRGLVRAEATPLIVSWESRLGVNSSKLIVQRMKTRWGTCNPDSAIVRLNTELSKKPLDCLEYVIVHELCHLLEPTHNARFVSLLDRHLPGWQVRRNVLNRLPVAHEHWPF